MPADCGGAPIGVTNLSRFDLSDEENVKDAAHQLRRCASDSDFAGWARKWGAAFVAWALEGPSQDDVENLPQWRELNSVHEALKKSLQPEVMRLEKIADREDIADSLSNDLADIIGNIEQALRVSA